MFGDEDEEEDDDEKSSLKCDSFLEFLESLAATSWVHCGVRNAVLNKKNSNKKVAVSNDNCCCRSIIHLISLSLSLLYEALQLIVAPYKK